jgi:hypothetical protein
VVTSVEALAQDGAGAQHGQADPDVVRLAFRLGWAIAELRGRYRLGSAHVALPRTGEGARHDHALPLAQERSEFEQKIETRTVLKALAGALQVDTPLDQGGGAPTEVIDRHCHELDDFRRKQPQSPPTASPCWEKLTRLLYSWDAAIQDTLVFPSTPAAAYQLGRGLAEVYWALDTAVTDRDDWCGWCFLLGDERREFLKRQTHRIAAGLDPLVPPAIAGSLDAWGRVAETHDWRTKDDVRQQLFRQVVLWRDLVRGEREPRELISDRGVPWKIGLVWPFVRTFAAQLIGGAVALGLMVAGIVALANGNTSKLAPLATVLGTLGVTGAGLHAGIKTVAQGLLGQLRRTYFKRLVAQAAVIVPRPPRLVRFRAEMAMRLGTHRL